MEEAEEETEEEGKKEVPEILKEFYFVCTTVFKKSV